MPDNILPSIIAGIFALIGSFFGYKLNSKSQREKVLLENRIPIFKNFLQTIDFCEKVRSKDPDIPYHNICKEVDSIIGITALHLNPKDLAKFYNLAKD